MTRRTRAKVFLDAYLGVMTRNERRGILGRLMMGDWHCCMNMMDTESSYGEYNVDNTNSELRIRFLITGLSTYLCCSWTFVSKQLSSTGPTSLCDQHEMPMTPCASDAGKQ